MFVLKPYPPVIKRHRDLYQVETNQKDLLPLLVVLSFFIIILPTSLSNGSLANTTNFPAREGETMKHKPTTIGKYSPSKVKIRFEF